MLTIRARQKAPAPTNPFKEGTAKYRIAKELIAVEVNRVKNLTGELRNDEVSEFVRGKRPPVSGKSSPASGSNAGLNPEAFESMMKDSLKELLGTTPPAGVQKLVRAKWNVTKYV